MSTPRSEVAAVEQIVAGLVAAGFEPYEVRFGTEGEFVSTERQAVGEILGVDISRLYVRAPDGGSEGWVLFVMGNGDPLDLVADWTTNLTEVIDPIMDTW